MDARASTTVMNVVFAMAILLGFFLLRRRLLKLHEMSELGRPLLANEAAKGFNACKVCAFENFKASRFCTLCGAPIATSEPTDGTSADDNGGTSADGRALDNTPDAATNLRGDSSNATVDGDAASEAMALTEPMLTSRQIRARKRKEWTRKLDIEGKMFWYRESSATSESPSLNRGFVVSFEADADSGLASASGMSSSGIDSDVTCELAAEPELDVAIDATAPAAVDVSATDTNRHRLGDEERGIAQANSGAQDTSNEQLQSDALSPPASTSPEPTESAGLATVSVDKTVAAMRKTPLRFLAHDVRVSVIEASQADAAVLTTIRSGTGTNHSTSDAVDPSTTDSAAVPTATATTVLDAIERKKEAIALAAQDFPTKFAHFVVSTAALLVPAEVEFLKLSVHRTFVLEESMEHLACIEERFIRSVMRIDFIDESGVDAGGLHREWFALLNELLMEPRTGLFVCTNASEQVYMLNAHSHHDAGADHLVYYYATGRLLGRALLEGVVLDFHLALPLRKLILGLPVSMSDLEDVDPETYRSMQWIAQHDGIDALALDFSVTAPRHRRRDSCTNDSGNDRVTVDSDGADVEVIDLVPNGRDVAVTDANKHAYLERKFHYMVFESVAPQLHALLKGIYEVVPPSLLVLFDAEELDYLLCGSQEIDVDDWIRWSVHSAFLALTPVLKWFWDIVREMPNEYRRRLLQFATGCSRVPLVGFRGLTSYDGKVCLFTIKALSSAGPQYIRSHACFNRIDLPLGATKRELKTMLYAILDTEVYGFTTN